MRVLCRAFCDAARAHKEFISDLLVEQFLFKILGNNVVIPAA